MSSEEDNILEDEKCHLVKEWKPVDFTRLVEGCSCDVVLHNTMRFDVHLSHVQPMLDDKYFEKETLVEAIREAIIKAVDDVVGSGLDGISIPGGALVLRCEKSKMLHRETISFDLS